MVNETAAIFKRIFDYTLFDSNVQESGTAQGSIFQQVPVDYNFTASLSMYRWLIICSHVDLITEQQ